MRVQAFAGRGLGIEVAGGRIDIGGGGGVSDAIQRRLADFRLAFGRCGCVGLAVGVALVSLQQRIALKLALDIGIQLDAGQLQKLDRLLQLRRDDEALALPQL